MHKEKAIAEMKEIFKEIPYGVDHTLKVLTNAEAIMEGEHIPEDERELISIVAILHDIGVMEAQRKYGSMESVYQEKEGPEVAKRILDKIGYDSTSADRVCYIIGNHHSPSKIDGMDFQIQWEADLLENLEYMNISKNAGKLKQYIDDSFKTHTGKEIAYRRFHVK